MKNWGLFFGILLLVVGFSTQAQAKYYIVFVSNRDGSDDIYLMDTDGNNQRNISANRARDWHPDWSADGTQIVFTSDRAGTADIWVMNANGTSPVNLTPNNSASDNSPDWSPDGNWIVFGSDRDGGQDLYLLNPTDQSVTRLTDDGIVKSAPSWSPDSQKVIYWAVQGDLPLLFSIDVNSREIVQLTTEGPNNWPAWYGDLIAFENTFNSTTVDIYVLDLAAGTSTNITQNPANDIRPAWSADGSQIIFASDRDSTTPEIYVMNADGAFPRRLTQNAAEDHSPAWQPVPAPIEFQDTGVVVQNFVLPQGSDLSGSQRMGEGEARLFAPTQVTTDDLIIVRLELEVDSSGEMPAATLQPTPTGTLRDRSSIEAFTIMGAELRGVDLTRFRVDPSPTEYVLRLNPQGVNFWEWMLRPNGNETIGKNFLSARIYVPQVLEDGIIAKQEVYVVNFEIEVVSQKVETAAQPLAASGAASFDVSATATAIAEQFIINTASPGFRILYSNPDSLTIITMQELDLNSLRIRSMRDEIALTEDFDILAITGGKALAQMCFRYVRYQTAPPLPADCQQQQIFVNELESADIFWHDPVALQLLDTVVMNSDSLLGICSGSAQQCDFSITNP